MKKIILGAVMALSMFAATAQVMGSNGVKNTLWSGFGSPDSTNENVNWYGLFDTLQARVDVGQFSIEGMINTGLFTNLEGGRKILFTDKTPFYVVNRISNKYSAGIDDANTNAYYVNFLWHPSKGLDFGAGTRLEWKVGPAPSCSDYYWGANAHVKEGGLKIKNPGATDVAGYVYYPNTYSSTLNVNKIGSLGVRYSFKDLLEIGMVIPSGTDMNDFSFNAGIKIQPMNLFNVSFAYEGVCKSEGHLYAGAQFFIQKNFTLNGFFAMNNLGGDNDNDGRTGFGLSAVYNTKNVPLTFTPEFGMTFYENADFSNAFFVGSGVKYNLNKQFSFGTWVSFAWGAYNKYWYNDSFSERSQHLGVVLASKYDETKTWGGGNVFAIRPTISMDINANNNLTLYADYQSRTAYNNISYSDWAVGIFWTYTK